MLVGTVEVGTAGEGTTGEGIVEVGTAEVGTTEVGTTVVGTVKVGFDLVAVIEVVPKEGAATCQGVVHLIKPWVNQLLYGRRDSAC